MKITTTGILAIILSGMIMIIAVIYGIVSTINQDTYLYTVKVERCNGKTDILRFKNESESFYIHTYNRAVPVLGDGDPHYNIIAINVCDYKILSKIKIKKK